MHPGLLVSIPLAEAEVYHIDLIPFRPFVTDGEVLGLDIPVQVVMGVHVLDAAELSKYRIVNHETYHLLSHEEGCQEVQFDSDLLHKLLEVLAEEFHNQDVVFTFGSKPVELWYPNYYNED